MKNFKQIICFVLVLVMVAAASVGITVAYLTDRDSKANVFTIGDVSIKLNESFNQGASLVPGVKIEKKPTIENTGINDAWVWATVAIPSALDTANDASKNIVHFNFSKESVAAGLWTWTDDKGDWMMQESLINGIEYNVYTVLYQTALSRGDSTEEPVITQVYLDTHMDIDPDGNMCWVENGTPSKPVWNVKENAYPVMYVSAYAVQKETFNTVQEAYAAYQAQWGNNGTEYGESVVTVTNLDQLNGALGNISYINMGADIDAENITVNDGESSTINLGDNTLSGDYLEVHGELTLENGDLATGTDGHYAAIAYGDVTLNDVDITAGGGGIASVYGGNVTVNGGSVNIIATTTNPRYNIYTEQSGSVVTIEGGTFNFTAKTLRRAYVYAGAGTTVYINGGTFGTASTRSGYTAGILGDGTVIITGGTFGFDPSNWVAAGYEAVKDGSTWTVQPVVNP